MTRLSISASYLVISIPAGYSPANTFDCGGLIAVERQDAGVDRRVVLLVASIASFLTPFMGSSINIALPSIGAEFGSDAVTLSWISTVYFLAAAVFLVPFGRLADIHGRRRVFLSGIVGYTVVSLLCGLTRSESMLIVLASPMR